MQTKASGLEGNEVICKCMQVNENDIRLAIEQGDLDTIEQVTDACNAGGGCHSCHILIQLFIDEYHGKTIDKQELVNEHAGKIEKKGILSTFFSKFKSRKP